MELSTSAIIIQEKICALSTCFQLSMSYTQRLNDDRKSFQWSICRSFCVLFRILGSVYNGKLSRTQYFYIIITFSSESTTILTNFIFMDVNLSHLRSIYYG
ncbi:hypothetical protein V1477_021033 [Vespula maculifrons]